jgi:hypothetical protein
VAIIDVFRAFTTAAVALANGASKIVMVGTVEDPARPYLHPEDVEIALDIDRFDIAVRVDFEDGRPVARVERPA